MSRLHWYIYVCTQINVPPRAYDRVLEIIWRMLVVIQLQLQNVIHVRTVKTLTTSEILTTHLNLLQSKLSSLKNLSSITGLTTVSALTPISHV